MSKVITGWDIEVAHEEGKKQLFVDQGAMVTDVALEKAKELGVALDKGFEQNGNGGNGNAWSGSQGIGRTAVAEMPARGVDSYIERYLDEFPLLKTHIHLANCSQSPQAKRVRAAINEYLDSWKEEGMNWEYWITEVNEAKKEFATLINASPDEVAVSTSVSAATASILSALRPYEGKNKIVTSDAEFPTVGQIALAFQKYGFKAEFVPVKDGQVKVEDYRRYVDETTSLVTATHVYYENGFKLDLKGIGDIAREHGAYYYVDAYQSLGTVAIDVKEMDIDILSTGNLKYLFGLPGIAFIYVKKDLIPKLKPAVTGWFGQENPFAFNVNYLDFASDARRFDTGTPSLITAFAAKAGMEIINEVGPKNIERHIQELSRFVAEEADRRGLDNVSPKDPKQKGATTAFRVEDPHWVEEKLKEHNIIASARGEVIRFAPHFFTTKEDLGHALAVLDDILRGR